MVTSLKVVYTFVNKAARHEFRSYHNDQTGEIAMLIHVVKF